MTYRARVARRARSPLVRDILTEMTLTHNETVIFRVYVFVLDVGVLLYNVTVYYLRPRE